jgi:hypothetical protein
MEDKMNKVSSYMNQLEAYNLQLALLEDFRSSNKSDDIILDQYNVCSDTYIKIKILESTLTPTEWEEINQIEYI